MKTSPEVEKFIKQATATGLIVWNPIKKRLFFVFSVAMVLSLSFVIYMTSSLFAYDDIDYRETEKASVVQVRLNQDKTVVDKVLQLQTANSGPVIPDYAPGRDNPFSEIK